VTKYAVQPTDVERGFGEDEIIVSKTDPTGRITYANDVFLTVALYTEREVIGQPHSIVRHPDMPRSVFKLLWDTIQDRKEIFAYVKNMAKNGDYYWVFAHVTPSYDAANNIIGYHSNRRCPRPEAIAKIEPIYQKLLAEENRHEDRKVGMHAAVDMLVGMLKDAGVAYDEFVFSL
jgi:PAS domain S-box-containing protein